MIKRLVPLYTKIHESKFLVLIPITAGMIVVIGIIAFLFLTSEQLEIDKTEAEEDKNVEKSIRKIIRFSLNEIFG